MLVQHGKINALINKGEKQGSSEQHIKYPSFWQHHFQFLLFQAD